jgi:hypothetical protein
MRDTSRHDPTRPRGVAAFQVAWIITMLLAVGVGTVGFVDGWARPELLGGPVVELTDELGLDAHVMMVAALILPLVAFLVLASFVFWRRPHDRMATLFGIATVGLYVVATRSPGVAFVTRPTFRPAIVVLTFLALAAVGLLLATFPAGRPTPRWGSLSPLLLVLALCAYPAFVEAQLALPELPAASGRFRLAAALASVGLLVGLASQVARYRQASMLVRRQITWVLAPLGLFLTAVVVLLVASTAGLLTSRSFAVGLLAVTPVGLAMPVAWARAILRYRLHDIDRIVSRTVTYACVVGVLVSAWVAGVVGLGTVAAGLMGEQSGDLAVAASTLAVIALFRPFRARVQTAVDRRFNRTGYQARQAVATFPARVRDELDLAAIRDDLSRTALVAVQPTSLSVWLTEPGAADTASAGPRAPAPTAHVRRQP